ncbi:uroporphyrinogen-III synthase [Jannaschia donghaensis]|uniref:Uroporphyrinogen-III synthase n=1 Tax=Jannaschia donghaensis TaxID=420998 RepID=A0A0M6YH51_9RHOB|nr:uroporphyrinogen-III synthase [Jannaschia donghaensis]CTQ49678.1 uroporphyrinogen-III synthase [Jannaschia donghaensis]
MHPCPVLLTRPQADAQRMVGTLREMGAQRVEVSPLLRIDPTGPPPEIAGGVILTSANAVAVLAGRSDLRGCPAWVVGPRTARLAEDIGLNVKGVAAQADTLVDLIPNDAPHLTHLRGEVSRGDIVGRLTRRGIVADERVVYRQTPLDLTASARALLRDGPVLVPLFSPRSARLFAMACPHDAVPNLRLLALSDAVAAECPVRPVGICETPDGAGMYALLKRRLTQIGG